MPQRDRTAEREARRTLHPFYTVNRHCALCCPGTPRLRCELGQGHDGDCAARDEERDEVVTWPGPCPIA